MAAQALPEKKEVTAEAFLGEKMFTGFIHTGYEGGEMFYTFFPSRGEPASDPFVMWLTGGPGCSSEIAWLQENGPFWGQPNATLAYNEHSWSSVANMLYVDQPLGTGFSETNDPLNYAKNEKQISKDMDTFLTKFLTLFPHLVDRPFYITGESYAGHYIPSIAHYLLQNPIQGLNFKGVAIGNGWVDPYTQFPAYADFAYANNLISNRTYQHAKKAYQACDRAVESGIWEIANVLCEPLTTQLLGTLNPYDIRLQCEVPPLCYNETGIGNFLNDPSVQEAMGVDKRWVDCNYVVHTTLLGDWILSVRKKVAGLLAAGKAVLIYNGDQDYICNWFGGLDWVHKIQWEHQADFRQKEMTDWVVDGKAVASQKTVENLTFMRVFSAGHMVPMDQPEVALLMFDAFLKGPYGQTRASSVYEQIFM